MLFFAAEAEGGGLAFPSLSNLIEWAPIIEIGGVLDLDKIGLTHLLGALIPAAIFILAGQQKSLVPTGIRSVAESVVEFVETQIILPAIGPDGLPYLSLLLSFFVFVFIGNITEVIPFFQMPANGRMGGPLVLALITLVVFTGVGIKHNGFSYVKDLSLIHI